MIYIKHRAIVYDHCTYNIISNVLINITMYICVYSWMTQRLRISNTPNRCWHLRHCTQWPQWTEVETPRSTLAHQQAFDAPTAINIIDVTTWSAKSTRVTICLIPTDVITWPSTWLRERQSLSPWRADSHKHHRREYVVGKVNTRDYLFNPHRRDYVTIDVTTWTAKPKTLTCR